MEPNSLAPFVASPQPVVDRMLEVASVKPGEMVYDLGCGDGRILITAVQKFHAKAVGVELNEQHAATATENIKRANLQNHAQVIKGNLMDVNIGNADVVTLYLMTLANEKLRPKLEHELRPGTRVVSLNFQVRGWKPLRVEEAEAYHRSYKIYLYEVPKAN
jgi:predicted RNA methylase